MTLTLSVRLQYLKQALAGDIPAEEEVMKDGVKLEKMNALLLKKVEELTLYVIELKKENAEIRVSKREEVLEV